MAVININDAPQIVDITILKDGLKAWDARGNEYKIHSIMLGVGDNRKEIPYTKHFLKADSECRAEILPDGKLKIIL